MDAVLFLCATSERFCFAAGKAAADREYEWRRIGHESLLVISMCQTYHIELELLTIMLA